LVKAENSAEQGSRETWMATEASVLSNLLSGLLGALLATIIGAVFAFWVERIKLKAEVMMAVVSWADETYIRLYDLHTAKEAHYTGTKEYFEPGEYERNSRDLRSMLLRDAITARVALAYGEGNQLALLKELRESLLSVTRKMWGAKKETWVEVDREVMAAFEQKIDPLRKELERVPLEQGSFPMRWIGIKKRLTEGPS